METKICSRCQSEKTLDCFRRRTRSKDGRKHMCIDCDDEYQKIRYIKQKNRLINIVKIWQDNNEDRVREYKRKWAKINF